ncbi:FecR domain-containing protein [Leptospira idonii]|uniref:Iron dicitrate transport regulator FecR n=1 Tax=Leptospira idonii TaxID=1193500 RepID=A0A4R9LYJ4_9LEPT|nr:FecR domain-containing protein [Leptospira idonii]TGN18681.1 iron dicitrate transport regulator FecR [Leptospira idonii]
MRLLNDTKYVIPFLIFLIGVFSFLLYRNLANRGGGSGSPSIGVITFKNKTVLRKYNDQVVWDTIESKTEVKNRDTIRTEGLSDAVLTLNDGTKINISENSMILLDISDKNININFAYGSFEAARERDGEDSKLNITAGDKIVEVGKGDIKLDNTKGELNLKVGEGEAKISANGKQEIVGKDQVASVTGDGVRVSKPKFGLVSPEDKKNFLTESGNETIQFSIAGVTSESLKDTNAMIEVATSPDFGKPIVKEKVKSASYSKNLSGGSYYWRISYVDPESKNKQSTETGRFRVLADPSLKLFSPKEGENYSYTDGLPIVKVSWQNLDLYSGYTVQISKDQGFSGDVKSKQTQNQSVAFDGLGDGAYFARVIARSSIPDVPEKVSSPVKFSIGKRLNLEAPVLLEPAKSKVFTKEQVKNQIFFTWKDNQDFNQFFFELSSDSSFSKILTKQSLQANFIKTGESLSEGNYFWRVKGSASGKEDLVSSVNSFSIVAKEDMNLISPSVNSEVEMDEKGSVTLRWKKLNSKATYTVEVSKTNDFTSAVLKETTQNQYYEAHLKDFGKFYWRVSADTSSGEAVSDVWSFVLNSSTEAPVLSSPAKNESIDMSNRSSISFSWKPTEKSSSYRIRILDISGIKEKIVLNEKTSKPSYNLTDLQKLSEGRYRWEVCSVYNTSAGEKESVYSRADFFISLPSLRIPKILTPGKIYVE